MLETLDVLQRFHWKGHTVQQMSEAMDSCSQLGTGSSWWSMITYLREAWPARHDQRAVDDSGAVADYHLAHWLWRIAPGQSSATYNPLRHHHPCHRLNPTPNPATTVYPAPDPNLVDCD